MLLSYLRSGQINHVNLCCLGKLLLTYDKGALHHSPVLVAV